MSGCMGKFNILQKEDWQIIHHIAFSYSITHAPSGIPLSMHTCVSFFHLSREFSFYIRLSALNYKISIDYWAHFLDLYCDFFF